jgi:hypothetical protein
MAGNGQRGREQADSLIITGLAAGLTYKKVAEQAGVSEKTVRNRLAQPEFRRKVAEARASLVEGTMAQLVAAGTEAVEALRRLLQAESESVQLGAARSLIELSSKLRESHDLETRIAALEAQANQPRRMNNQWLA